MKTLIRAGIMLAVAGGFCLAFSLSASADVVEPNSAYQPAFTAMLEDETAVAAKLAEQAAPQAAKEEAAAAAQKQQVSESEATPAPEQAFRPASVPVIKSSSSVSVSLVNRITHPLRIGLEHIEASLGRVVSACETGFGTGNGGPMFVFAVLALAVPLIRRRVIGTRWTTDEDVPEFLFAWELTPPG